MGIRSIRPIKRPILDVVPELPLDLPGPDVVGVDDGAQAGHVDRHGQEPPLAHQADVELGRDDGEQDADGVARRQQVHDEEVVRVRPGRHGGHEQRDGGLLRRAELREGVRALRPRRPRVPVLQHQVLVLLEQRLEVVEPGRWEEVLQALVAGHLPEQLERGRTRRRAR